MSDDLKFLEKKLFRKEEDGSDGMNWDHCQSCDVFYLVELGCPMCEKRLEGSGSSFNPSLTDRQKRCS